MPEDDDKPREMKVTDRRMFTPEGELREEFRDVGTATAARPAPAPEEPAERPAARPATSAPGPADGPRGAAAEMPDAAPGAAPSFYDLVAVLAEPVPLYLGDTALPDGRSAENLEAARFHIDLLDLLRQRTTASLTAEESGVLEDVLYRLRMRFVQKRG